MKKIIFLIFITLNIFGLSKIFGMKSHEKIKTITLEDIGVIEKESSNKFRLKKDFNLNKTLVIPENTTVILDGSYIEKYIDINPYEENYIKNYIGLRKLILEKNSKIKLENKSILYLKNIIIKGKGIIKLEKNSKILAYKYNKAFLFDKDLLKEKEEEEFREHYKNTEVPENDGLYSGCSII
ncbi:hypothetical protein GF385_00500 [Candidatus Dependentiae bacterium]|nr:hypothetical protein [Candidatus Dependentiae bacterium]